MECSRCHSIVSASNKTHEKNCDRFWNLLTKEKNRIWCTFCDKSYSSISGAFKHMSKLHYNSVNLKNLVNLHSKDQFEVDNVSEEEEDNNWSDIEFDDGEVDKDQSCLNLNTSINIKENLIDTPKQKKKAKNSVLVIDIDEEDFDIPDLEETTPPQTFETNKTKHEEKVKLNKCNKRLFGKSEGSIQRETKGKEKMAKSRHSDLQPLLSTSTAITSYEKPEPPNSFDVVKEAQNYASNLEFFDSIQKSPLNIIQKRSIQVRSDLTSVPVSDEEPLVVKEAQVSSKISNQGGNQQNQQNQTIGIQVNLDNSNTITEKESLIEIQKVRSLEKSDLTSDIIEIKTDEKQHPILSFADVNEPFAVKQLHMCPFCNEHFLTHLSVAKHIEKYHKIPIDKQAELHIEITAKSICG